MPENAVQLKFRQLPGSYAVLRLGSDAASPAWAKGEFVSITRSSEGLSIVCPEGAVPPDIDAAPAWICLKLEGLFPFSQTGVLLSFIEPLSKNRIPIFAISTYDTDYVLVQEQFAESAIALLRDAGHELCARDEPRRGSRE